VLLLFHFQRFAVFQCQMAEINTDQAAFEALPELTLANESLWELSENGVAKIPNHKWCPSSKCTVSNICKPCDRKFLIIMSVGRGASTTLTWMMDQLPGVRMAGENNDLLKKVHDTLSETVYHPIFMGEAGRKGSSWGHNKIQRGTVACAVQHIFETINQPLPQDIDDKETIIGFKTVRFHENITMKNLSKYVQFVKESFPCARIIVNIRSDVEALTASIKKQKWSKGVETSLISAEAKLGLSNLKQIAKLFGEQAILLDSTKWTKNVDEINRVVDWLGFESTCHFKEIMELNTNGRARGGQVNNEMSVTCKYAS